MWIVRLALRRTYTFVVASMLIAVLGAVSIYRMSTDIFPDIDIPVVSVVWQFSGMPAEEMETRMILINERILTSSVNEIEHIESQSLDGVGVIRIYFHPGAKIAEAEAQVTATCQTLLKIMPPGVTPPYIVRYSATSVPIVQIAVSSDTLTEERLYDYANNVIIQRLGAIQGARVPAPWGGKWPQIMVDLDLDALFARGLSPNDIIAAILNQNLIVPAGNVKIGEAEYNVKLNSSPSVVAAFNDIPVKTVNGMPICIKDVANVRNGYAVQMNVVRRDGRRAILMTILKGEGASTLGVVRRVRQAMPGIQAQIPPEIKLDFLFDQSVFVRAAVEGVLKEGALAAGLTALMILLFLGSWRGTLIVATSIPLSILASVIVLWGMGYSLNTMTLGGMALAVGILVDDATVELENVHRNIAMKKPLRRAILDGASQIAVPAFVSTLCICIVFVPVVFLTGPAAYLFTPLALAVVFAMLASYFLSRTLVPTMVLYLLRAEAAGRKRKPGTEGGSTFHKAFNRGFERLRHAYSGCLAWALDHRLPTLGVLLGFAIGSSALFPRLGQDFFPAVDAGQFRMHVRAPAGTRIEETERIFGQVEDAIRAVVPDSQRALILDNMGVTQAFTIMAYIDNGTVSEADGEILVGLKPEHAAHGGVCRPPAAGVAETISAMHVLLRAGRHHQPDPQLQPARPHRRASGRRQTRGEPRRGPQVATGDRQDRRRGQRPPAPDGGSAGPPPERRPRPGLGIGADPAGRGRQHVGLAQFEPAGFAQLLGESREPHQLPRGRANPAPPHRLAGCPVEHAHHQRPESGAGAGIRLDHDDEHGGGAAPALEQSGQRPPLRLGGQRQPLRRAAGLQRLRQCSGPRPGGRRRRRAADHRRGQTRSAAGQHDCHARAGRDHGKLVHRAGGRTGVCRAPRLLPDGGQLPELARPVHHPHGPAGGAGGHCVDAVCYPDDLDRAGLDGRDHVHRRGHVEQHPRDHVCQRSAARGLRRPQRGPVGGTTRLRPVLMTALAMIMGMLPMSLGLGEGGEQNAPLGRAVIGGLLVATFFTLFFVPVMYSLLRRKPPAPERSTTMAMRSNRPPRRRGRCTFSLRKASCDYPTSEGLNSIPEAPG